MTATYSPAEVFPAGEYLRDELDERGWSVTEFAEILGRPLQAVSEILNGKKRITTETAISIAEATGTSAELWLNLETAYRLHQQRSEMSPGVLTPVARRARLRSAVPLAEIRKRGWLPEVADATDLDGLEGAVCTLLGVRSVDERPEFAVAARRSNPNEHVTIEQAAWLGHVRQVASGQRVGPYDPDALRSVAAQIPRIVKDGPSELRHVSPLLADCGVRLVFAEGLRGGKLDGAVTFLPDERPAIGVTTRGNRFDSTLFTLLHECAHLTFGHITPTSLVIIDDDLTQDDPDPREVEANAQASNWLFPDGFEIESTSMSAIVEAATRYQVHPSVVVGRVQHDTKYWSRHRSHIPKVRQDLEISGLLS
jgi:HTH-type transcriptional regulator/antitoxin HigA